MHYARPSTWYELYTCHPTIITKCTKFGQLILRKIIKIVATRCQIVRLKCTKFDFGWGSAGGKGRPGGEGGKGWEGKFRGKGGEGEKGGKGKFRGPGPPNVFS